MKKTFFIAVVLAIALSLVAPTSVLATPASQQDTCPEGNGWVKVNVNAQSYSYTPPDGYTVGDNCYKAGTTLVFGSGPDVESTVWNKEGCPGENGCNYQNISHASFQLIPDQEPERYTLYDWNSDCDGWWVTAQDYEDGNPAGSPYQVDGGSWSNPTQLEEATSQYIDGPITEPENCLVTDTYEYVPDPNCEGWFLLRVYSSGLEELVAEGQWSDPDKLEEFHLVGDDYDFTFYEPENCGEGDPTPTPTRPRDNPPDPPKTGGGFELFILAGGTLLGIGAFSLSALRRNKS